MDAESASRPGLDALLAAAVALAGVALGLHYARMGFMPLDHSVVFDGGWRTLCGQVPFRDYHAPSGITPALMQAPFFAVLGVSWFAYALHAALVNGAFGALGYALLVRLGLARPAAAVYGLLGTVVLYPPMGVPLMDEHSFFFALLALALAVWAATAARSRRETAAWLLLPAVTLAGYLSKQVPAIFLPPVIVALALRGSLRESARRIGLMAAGTLAMLIAVAALVPLLGIDLERLRLYWFELPAEVGALRLERFGGIAGRLQRVRDAVEILDSLAVPLTLVAAAPVLVAGLALWIAGRRRNGIEAVRRAHLAPGVVQAALLALVVLAIDLAYIALTNNQPEIGAGLLYLALGLAHLGLFLLARLARPALAATLRVAGVVLLVGAVADAWSFDREFNRTRSANDYTFDPALAASVADELPAGLRFLRWSVPPHYTYTPRDLDELIAFLAARPDPFLLLGDTSILYGLAGKPSTMPSLWFHPRAALPMEDDPRFGAYEDLVLESMRRHGVRFVVQEGERTWMHRRLDQFPRLSALVAERTAHRHTFGPFTVYELGDG
jgi:hypothetical protein